MLLVLLAAGNCVLRNPDVSFLRFLAGDDGKICRTLLFRNPAVDVCHFLAAGITLVFLHPDALLKHCLSAFLLGTG